MVNKIITSFFLIFMLYYDVAYSQEDKHLHNYINVYEITDSVFHNLLDTIIYYEDRYGKTSKNLIFDIFVGGEKGQYFIIKSTNKYKQNKYLSFPRQVNLKETGILYYKKSIFIIGKLFLFHPTLVKKIRTETITRYIYPTNFIFEEDDTNLPCITWICVYKNKQFKCNKNFLEATTKPGIKK